MLLRWLRRGRVDSKPTEIRNHIRTPTKLKCTIDLGEGNAAVGEILDLSIGGSGIRIPFENLTTLEQDQELELTIHGPLNSWMVWTRAKLRHLRAYRAGMSYLGVAFENLGDLYSQLEHGMGSYFNRRRSKRVNTVDQKELSGKIKSPRHAESIRIRDLSATGASVALNSFQATDIEVGSMVDLRLTLPRGGEELSGRTIVRHRDQTGPTVRLGLEFDADPTVGFARHSAKLEEFVEELHERVGNLLLGKAS
jgi:hypothetical protein